MQQEAGYSTHCVLLVGASLQDSRRLPAEQSRVHILSSAFERCLQPLLLARRIGIARPGISANHLSACCQWQYPVSDALGKMRAATVCHKGAASDSHPSEPAGVPKLVDGV